MKIIPRVDTEFSSSDTQIIDALIRIATRVMSCPERVFDVIEAFKSAVESNQKCCVLVCFAEDFLTVSPITEDLELDEDNGLLAWEKIQYIQSWVLVNIPNENHLGGKMLLQRVDIV